MSDGRWVSVKAYMFLAEADLDRAILTGNGIEAIIRSDTAGGMIPSLTLQHEAQLLVHEEDLEAAEEVLGRPDSA
jgi:hypothetical protein